MANITIANWKKMASGVNSPKADFNYPISISNKKISVDGVQSGVNVYNISGQLLQAYKGNGKFTSQPFTSGVYILQVDKAETKILID